jgi:hypothetical protein
MSVVIFIWVAGGVAVPGPAHPETEIIDAKKNATIAYRVTGFTPFIAEFIFLLLAARMATCRPETPRPSAPCECGHAAFRLPNG